MFSTPAAAADEQLLLAGYPLGHLHLAVVVPNHSQSGRHALGWRVAEGAAVAVQTLVAKRRWRGAPGELPVAARHTTHSSMYIPDSTD